MRWNFFLLVIFSLCLVQVANGNSSDNADPCRLKVPPAKRIISLAPNLSELLCEIGAGQQIVGRDRLSIFPELKAIPIVADYYHINLENIILLKPDLIVAEAANSLNKDLRQLEHLGIPVFIFHNNQLLDIPRTLIQLGALTGHEPIATLQANNFAQKLTKLTKLTKKATLKPTVFYVLWQQPLMSVSNKTLIGEMIQRCGGKNIIGNTYSSAPLVNLEWVINNNPDLIIVSSLLDKKKWTACRALNAVKNDHVIYIPPELIQKQGPQLLLGMEKLCHYIALIQQ